MKKIVETPDIQIYTCPYGDYVVDEEGNMVNYETYLAFKKLEEWVNAPSPFWSNMLEGITVRYM